MRATAYGVARATVEADIKRMFDDLKAEKKRGSATATGKPADLGSRWVPCHPRTIEVEPGGCEEAAEKIRREIGGETYTIRPPGGAKTLGPYRGYDARWPSHEVVVHNGRVYDAWTSRYGEPVDVYKSRWEHADVLEFGF